eukprot:scaffold24423_cov18-Phaeocystis_antarctica.AAC.1
MRRRRGRRRQQRHRAWRVSGGRISGGRIGVMATAGARGPWRGGAAREQRARGQRLGRRRARRDCGAGGGR